MLQPQCRQSLQSLVHRIPLDAGELQGRDPEQGLDALVADDDAACRHVAHELDADKGKVQRNFTVVHGTAVEGRIEECPAFCPVPGVPAPTLRGLSCCKLSPFRSIPARL